VALGGGAYATTWIDAQDTARRTSGGVVRSGTGLAAPASGSDWLLSLVREQ
jgi:hypothetical protein